MAKCTRLSFPVSTSKTSKIFELLHIDVWGKYKTPTYNNQSYFLTIVDDYSRATWAILLQNKGETTQKLKTFIKEAQNQFDTNVKIIRTDNGTEFINSKLQNLLKELGIRHQLSCPYTSQQNSVVERKHRHILDIARCLMFQSATPDIYWGECIKITCYLINRTPSPIINNETPYFRLFQKEPSYENLMVFGCLCFFKTNRPTKKFKPRAIKGVILGYSTQSKGYKVLDLENNDIHITRDVTFYETIFPFKNKTKESEEDIILITNTKISIEENPEECGNAIQEQNIENETQNSEEQNTKESEANQTEENVTRPTKERRKPI